MGIEIALENSMTAAIYAGIGQTVTYDGAVAGSVSIKAVISRAQELFPGGFEINASDDAIDCRVLIADVAAPRRGDTVTDANTVEFIVDSYEQLNESEWMMRLKVNG